MITVFCVAPHPLDEAGHAWASMLQSPMRPMQSAPITTNLFDISHLPLSVVFIR